MSDLNDNPHQPIPPRRSSPSSEDEAAQARLPHNYVQVRELKCNTNLHVAPDNWLQGEFTSEPWIPGSSTEQQATDAPHARYGIHMQSVAKANAMLNAVGHLDVMSDAHTVKKVLTLPYRKQQDLSMLVHRIGRTLLIDPVELQAAGQQRKPQTQQATPNKHEQQKLKQLAAKLSQPDENALLPVPVQRQVLEEKLIMSKFLYHSLDMQQQQQQQVADAAHREQAVNSVVELVLDNHESPLLDVEVAHQQQLAVLPDPLDADNDATTSGTEGHSSPTKTAPNPAAPLKSQAVRSVCWTFEDSRMLIDTDMPIFGCGQHPCVSLKLRDMKKPITVLTGLDYWLDQLMCNVPEVLMCYHLNGLVQKYELMKTEDLPNVTETPFDPVEVREVATNIFSFLKSNATKEGHTYWLFKGQNDDVVKLYDLSSVCSELMDVDANPYTLPVAMVMYRVAHNLMQQARSVRRVANTVYRLLNNCLDLLPNIKYPQVVGSVHYLIANLYITYAYESLLSPDDVAADDLFAADFENESWQSTLHTNKQRTAGEKDEDAQHQVATVTLQALCHPSTHDQPFAAQQQQASGSTGRRLPLPNSTNRDDCCKQALEHVIEGLEFVDAGDMLLSNSTAQAAAAAAGSASNNTSSMTSSDDVTVDRHKPIPMKYEPLYSAPQCNTLIPYALRRPRVSTWQTQLYCLLLSRASLAYTLLTDASSRLDHYGRSLRYIRSALVCLASVMSVHDSLARPSSAVRKCYRLCGSLLVTLIGKAADQYVLLSKLTSNERGRHEFELTSAKLHFRDQLILAVAEKSLRTAQSRLSEDLDWVTASVPASSLQQTQLAIRCYETAINMHTETLGSSRADSFARLMLTEAELRQKLGSAHNDVGKFYTAMLNDLVLIGRLDESQTKQIEPLAGDATEQLLYLVNTSLLHYGHALPQLNSAGDAANEVCGALNDAEWLRLLRHVSKDSIIGERTAAVHSLETQALVYNNCARVQRLHSHACAKAAAAQQNVDVSETEFTKKEQELLNKAIDYYLRATECLAKGQSMGPNEASMKHQVVQSQLMICSQLAGVYYSVALQLQDRPPLSSQPVEQIERSVADYLHRAIGIYEKQLAVDNALLQTEAFNRLFECHHRLAAMYHNTHRQMMANDSSAASRKGKNVRTLTEMHYNKTDQLFAQWLKHDPNLPAYRVLSYLRVSLQHVAYHEHNAALAATTAAGSACNRAALATLLGSSRTAIACLGRAQESHLSGKSDGRRKKSAGSSKQQSIGGTAATSEHATGDVSEEEGLEWLESSDERTEWRSLCGLLLNRLQQIVHGLLKTTIKAKHTDASTQSALKSAYAQSLSVQPDNCIRQPRCLVDVCEQIGGSLSAYLQPAQAKEK